MGHNFHHHQLHSPGRSDSPHSFLWSEDHTETKIRICLGRNPSAYTNGGTGLLLFLESYGHNFPDIDSADNLIVPSSKVV